MPEIATQETNVAEVAETSAPVAAETNTAVAEKPVKATKKAAKKPAAKAKAATKKAPAKKAAKASTNGAPREKKEGLRKPQIRILHALAKAGKPLTRGQISDKAPVDNACCTEYIGSDDAEVRAANDKRRFPSLLTLGLLKTVPHQDGDKATTAYDLSAKGAKEVEKLKAEGITGKSAAPKK